MFKYLLIFLFLTLTACGTSAQSNERHNSVQPTILIDATGEFQAPADIIWFQINLNRFDKEAEKAFEEHKKLERYLTDLLLEQGYNHDDINANPVSISPRRYTNDQGFETSQRVSVKLTEITRFESMQILLIQNGFDNFSGSFSTSMQKEASENALEDAVAKARRSAEILAGASGLRVGEAVSIEYTSSYGPVYREAMALSRADAGDGGMLQFQTTITVQENVRVKFLLNNL
jgi:uncharacterized protein